MADVRLASDVAVAAQFLRDTIRDHIHLVAISPDPPQNYRPPGRWFGDDALSAVHWAERQNNDGLNVYWTVNVTRAGLHKKPEKSDIAAARFAHVDLDPPKDGSSWRKAAKMNELFEFDRPPSFINDSGNGLQALWRLDYMCENWAAIEEINKRLEHKFGGDHCHNIDRLLRVPGFINFPNRAKRDRGRTPVLSGIAEPDSGEAIDPVDLDAELPELPPHEHTKRERVQLADVDLATLQCLKITALNRLHGLITASPNPDRSGATYAVACEMVRQGYSDLDIAGILLNPNLAISAHCLDQASPKRAVERAISRARADVSAQPPAPGDNGHTEASEDAIALAFTAQHGSTLRFDHSVGHWLRWTGVRWEMDETDLALDYARTLARTLGDGKRALCKSSVARGAEAFARADRTHAVSQKIWDRDPMLLGTPAGTVDLRTGILSPANPEDHISKLTGVAPEHGAPELWLRFLHEALAGNEEAIQFLQLWAGYCLTGLTIEQALLFLHGLAGTGKTVFLNTLSRILGDYAVTAAMETFTASKYDRHSTELAMLRGARLVTASETEEGRAWAESRIKALTGGDPITARFMRQDHFTFRPQFKLTIVGNHAPRLTNPDDAMRRRFNILGFNVKPTEPDSNLEQKLEAEHGRILAWAITGCRAWQEMGLIRPAVVTDATSEYFAGEDLLGQWLAERCVIAPGKWDMPARLYGDWKKYAEGNGEIPGTAIAFGKKLKKKGFQSKASNGVRQYQGIELQNFMEADHDYSH